MSGTPSKKPKISSASLIDQLSPTPNFGKKKQGYLAKEFPSQAELTAASAQDIARVPRVGGQLAQMLKSRLDTVDSAGCLDNRTQCRARTCCALTRPRCLRRKLHLPENTWSNTKRVLMWNTRTKKVLSSAVCPTPDDVDAWLKKNKNCERRAPPRGPQ